MDIDDMWDDEEDLRPFLKQRHAPKASPASAPEGFALVPVVPTNAILDVMFDAGIDRHDGDLTLLYRAILAAAPTPPVSEDRKWVFVEPTKDRKPWY